MSTKISLAAFFDEATKIAKAKARHYPNQGRGDQADHAGLGLTSKPWDLGIYSKRRGENYRGPAYGYGIPSAAVGGAAAGAAVGAGTGGALTRTLTEAGRKRIVDEFADDLGDVGLAKGKSGLRAVQQAAEAAARGDARGAAKAVGRGVVGGLRGDAAKAVLRRRFKAGVRGTVRGMALGGLGRLAHNIGSYEYARASSPKNRRLPG